MEIAEVLSQIQSLHDCRSGEAFFSKLLWPFFFYQKGFIFLMIKSCVSVYPKETVPVLQYAFTLGSC